MADYYDWRKTIAYDADITMVVGERGVGKTYGLRLQLVRDHINNDYNFVEVVRHKNELSGVANGYFDRITSNDEFPGKVFMTNNNMAFIADKPDNDDEKPKWELCGYFVAMSQAQQLKKRTFNKVKRIVFDEAILDKRDRYHNYLYHEYEILANIVDTVSRERADVECIHPRVYLLANALDVLNPYFTHYNVGVPKHGYHWYAGKTFLLHYAKHGEYAKAKASETVAGRMLANTEGGMVANDNKFAGLRDDFVMRKTREAKFSFGIYYDGNAYGVWGDWNNGYYFVTSKIPNNTDKPVYTLTLEDNRLNYVAARRAEIALSTIADLHYTGCMRYESVSVQERFRDILRLFGVR